MNARFWVWWNDGWVKLTGKPGQRLTFSKGGPTDEGWSREGETYYFDNDPVTPGVVCQSGSDGRDCDGRFSTYAEYFCSFQDLSARELEDGRRVPIWQKTEASRRDYTAESMGY